MPEPSVRYEVTTDGASEHLKATNMKDAVVEGREWLADGDWDTSDGESYTVTGYVTEYTTTVDEDGEEDENETDSRYVEIEIEVDEEATIRNQVGRAYVVCNSSDGVHEWESTYEREGGCSSNPGVWSSGGTSLTYKSHCKYCPLLREDLYRGSQCNPGEGDRVKFSLCEDWDEKYAEIAYAWNSCLQNDETALLICTASKGSLEREATYVVTKDSVDLEDNPSDTDRPFDEDGWPEPPESEVLKARRSLQNSSLFLLHVSPH